MSMISVGVFFAILLALNNIVMFVNFLESPVIVYMIVLLAFAVVQAFIFGWFIVVIKERATGYFN